MKVAILGCGRWASFHAWYQAVKLKNDVLVWGRAEDCIFTDLLKFRKNGYLELPESVGLTNDLKKAVNHAEYIIISISAQGVSDLASNIKKQDVKNKTFVLCMKGIDNKTGERLSQILKRDIDASNNICVWVGPGHVQDFLSGQPNVMIIDGENAESVADVVKKFRSDLIKLYEGDDLIGVEVGAAAKNVMGLAAGMLDGAKMSSLKGALMARGVYEVSQLTVAMGGNQLTPYGISHIGDYEATLFSQNSHNRRYGEEYIKSKLSGRLMKQEGLAEGVETVKAMMLLSEKYNVEMPISSAVYKVIHENKNAQSVLKELFARVHNKEFR